MSRKANSGELSTDQMESMLDTLRWKGDFTLMNVKRARFPVFLMMVCLGGYALGLLALRKLEYEHEYNHLIGGHERALLALLPTIPMTCFVVIFLRQVNKLDEMWRKLLTDSMAFAGLSAAFTCLCFQFMQDLGERVQPWWGFQAFWIFYALGVAGAVRRLR